MVIIGGDTGGWLFSCSLLISTRSIVILLYSEKNVLRIIQVKSSESTAFYHGEIIVCDLKICNNL